MSGIGPGRSRMTAGAGIKAQLNESLDVFANYDLEARSGYQGHSASFGVGISF
jgi:outer membrane autotransporter protein